MVIPELVMLITSPADNVPLGITLPFILTRMIIDVNSDIIEVYHYYHIQI